jgi:hypothetical protein
MNTSGVNFVFFTKPNVYRVKLFAGAGQAA